jgi:hypothetical protein
MQRKKLKYNKNRIFLKPQNDNQKKKILSKRENQKLENGVCKKLIPKWTRIPCKFPSIWMNKSAVKKVKKRTKPELTIRSCGKNGSKEKCDNYLEKLTNLIEKAKEKSINGKVFNFKKAMIQLRVKAEDLQLKYHQIQDLNETFEEV